MPFRHRWWARGDVNGFFALAVDNLALLVGMAGILTGVFGLPAQIVVGRMVPGTAAGVLVGDLLYTWLALRLARRERRQDVCAMPLGIDAPSMFALSFGVVGPAFAATHDAEVAWRVGMAVLAIMGVAKIAVSFAGDLVRRLLPRTALLGALAAVAVALIMFFPLVRILAEPVGGLVALGVVLLTLVGGLRTPAGLPAVMVSVGAGLAAYALAVALGYHPPPLPSVPAAGAAIPWPSLRWLEGLPLALPFLPLALPVALATVVGGIDNTESAAAAGDSYRTRDILLVEGVATLAAAFCGGVIQNTPYIGHGAYKRMGSRAAYTLAAGLAIGIGAASGAIGALIGVLPESVVVPILVFVGLEMGVQAMQCAPPRHLRALVLAMVPVLANLVNIELGTVLGAAGIDPARLPAETQRGLQALSMLGNGFIVSAMLWATWLIWLIDGRLRACAGLCAAAAVLVLFGVIHSPHRDGSLLLPWHEVPAPVAALAAGYALLALLCLGAARWGRRDETLIIPA